MDMGSKLYNCTKKNLIIVGACIRENMVFWKKRYGLI